MDIFSILCCLSPCLDRTTLRQLAIIVSAILSMPDRVTMLGISRWTEKGGSYRTIQRFFKTKIDWAKVQWVFIRTHLRGDSGEIILTGDEVVTPKAGKKTYGLGRFFSSVYNKPIPGMCHLQLSLTPVEEERSYPLITQQIHQTKKNESSKKKPSKSKSKRKAKKKKCGRPKGSRNQNRRDVEFTETQKILQENIRKALALVDNTLKLRFFVYDGALGHNAGVRLVRQCGLHLISKLRYNSALHFPYDGPYSGRGPQKKYGDQLDYTNIPKQYLKSSAVEDDIRTDTYQMIMRHKKFANQLNVVIIVKTNLKTLKRAHVVLFSSDLELACDKLVKYYRLRFQIEFNFRDAKQYWGLDDFMNIKEQQVCNAANLAFFMVNVSHILRRRSEFSGMSVIDLKAWFRAGKYVRETLKLLPQIPEGISIQSIANQVAVLGRVNTLKEVV
jgi:hypothetical protein